MNSNYEKKKHQLTGDILWKINDIDLAITDGGSSIVKDFIDENIILKNDKILIIHGKGLGVVRKSVHNVLSKRKEVTKYHTDNLNDGCTIVYLSVDN